MPTLRAVGGGRSVRAARGREAVRAAHPGRPARGDRGHRALPLRGRPRAPGRGDRALPRGAGLGRGGQLGQRGQRLLGRRVGPAPDDEAVAQAPDEADRVLGVEAGGL